MSGKNDVHLFLTADDIGNIVLVVVHAESYNLNVTLWYWFGLDPVSACVRLRGLLVSHL